MAEEVKDGFSSLKTVFNMDIAYLGRLDRLLDFFDVAMLKYDMENALLVLKRIYSSIYPKLEKEANEIEKDLDKIYGHRKNYYSKRDGESWKLWYDGIEKLDKKLRKLMKTYGIIFQDTADPRFAALRR